VEPSDDASVHLCRTGEAEHCDGLNRSTAVLCMVAAQSLGRNTDLAVVGEGPGRHGRAVNAERKGMAPLSSRRGAPGGRPVPRR